MDFYNILNIPIDASKDDIKLAFSKSKKQELEKKAYSILKHTKTRYEYDKKLLQYYRSKVNKNKSKNKLMKVPIPNFFNDDFNEIFKPTNFMKSFNNMMINMPKDSKTYSHSVISSTKLGEDGNYVTQQSVRTNKNGERSTNNKTIKYDKEGNKTVVESGPDLFKITT